MRAFSGGSDGIAIIIPCSIPLLEPMKDIGNRQIECRAQPADVMPVCIIDGISGVKFDEPFSRDAANWNA